MKTKLNLIPLVLIGALLAAVLMACGATAADQEPTAESSVDTPDSALESVTEEATVEQTESEGTSEESAEAVEPVEVDLGAITPDPIDENPEPQEMPAPGRPGPDQALMDAIMADLADRRGVSLEDLAVQIESIEVREWPDSSLGCPADGMMYMQVITPGYLVELNSSGELYRYHTDQRQAFVLCVDGKPAD